MTLSPEKIQSLLGPPKARPLIERTELDIAWAAGLFEGEGSCSISNLDQPRVELTSCDEDIVLRFASIIGFGAITTRKRRKDTHKQAWTWYVQEKYNVIEAISLLLPYLGERRKMDAHKVLDKAKSKRDYRRKASA
jgi:hypothetical protein